MFDFDVVIVGGGPAGITAAMNLHDEKVLLLEADERLGGRLKSYPRDGYWVNLGGHLFPGEGSHMQEILKRLGLRTIEIPGIKFAMTFNGKFYKYKRVESYPLRLPMTLAERAAMIKSGVTIMKAVRGWHKAMRPRADESEVQRRARVSEYLSDRSFRQLIGTLPDRVDAIYRSAARRAASEIDVQSAGVGVSLFGAVWSGEKSSMALNLDGGSGMLGAAAAKHLGDRVLFGATVSSVRQLDEGVSVTYIRDDEQVTVTARHAILAVPAPIASQVVQGLPDDVSRTLRSVSYGPFLTMGILTDESGPMVFDDVYATTTPAESFDMFFNHANPIRGNVRTRGGSLMVYSGGDPAEELMNRSDAEIVETYLADLFAIFPELSGHVKETIVQRWEYGNTYRKPGMDFTPMLAYSARTDTKIHFCGDWFAELGNMEVAAGSALEAVAVVKQSLAGASGG